MAKEEKRKKEKKEKKAKKDKKRKPSIDDAEMVASLLAKEKKKVKKAKTDDDGEGEKLKADETDKKAKTDGDGGEGVPRALQPSSSTTAGQKAEKLLGLFKIAADKNGIDLDTVLAQHQAVNPGPASWPRQALRST